MTAAALHQAFAWQARKENKTVALSLNSDDLPEAKVWPQPIRNYTTCHRTGRVVKGRFNGNRRTKSIGIPVLSEDVDEDMSTEDVDDDGCDTNDMHASWACLACSLINHGLLPSCEVCGTKRTTQIVQSAEISEKDVPSIGSSLSHDWPALPEASVLGADTMSESWVDCDVSSVASSWLDIGSAECFDIGGVECFDIGGDDNSDVVVVRAFDVQKPAGPAPLWSAIVSTKHPSAVRPVAVLPPLFRKPAVRRVATVKEEEEEEEEWDVSLDQLEARRMAGTGGTGISKNGGRRRNRK